MDWLTQKIDNALTWFADVFRAIFVAITTWLQDFAIWMLDTLLTGVAALLEAIPVPSFMSNGLSGLFTALPPPLLYLLDQSGIAAGVAIIGAGVLFNLTRKLLTLGQW